MTKGERPMSEQQASAAPPRKPEKVTNSKGSRYYTWPDPNRERERRLISSTTIIKEGIPKGEALVNWAARITAEMALDNLDLLYAMLKRGQRQQAIDYLREERYRVTDRARITGSQIHDAIEAYKLEKPFPGVPDDVADYYGAFLQMIDDQRPIILQTEANVYHRERGYAGQLDTIAVWPKLAELVPRSCPSCRAPAALGSGHAATCPTPDLPPTEFTHADPRGPVLIADYKTGKGPKKGGVYPEVALQLASYANAEFIGAADLTEHPLPAIDGALAIHLQPGWCELIPVYIGPEVFTHFLYAAETLRWGQDLSKRVIGRPLAVYEMERPELVRPVFEPVKRTSIYRVAHSRTPKEGEELPVHAVGFDPQPAPKGNAYVALCGVAVRHITDDGFSPTGRRVCSECGAKAKEGQALHDAATQEAPQEAPKLQVVKDDEGKLDV